MSCQGCRAPLPPTERSRPPRPAHRGHQVPRRRSRSRPRGASRCLSPYTRIAHSPSSEATISILDALAIRAAHPSAGFGRHGCECAVQPFQLDRFDAYLDGELILTSRQPRYDGARELPRCGYPGDTLLTVRHAGKDHDRVVSLEIGYLAQWSISDSDRGGLKRIRWQPMPEHLKQRGRRGRE